MDKIQLLLILYYLFEHFTVLKQIFTHRVFEHLNVLKQAHTMSPWAMSLSGTCSAFVTLFRFGINETSWADIQFVNKTIVIRIMI